MQKKSPHYSRNAEEVVIQKAPKCGLDFIRSGKGLEDFYNRVVEILVDQVKYALFQVIDVYGKIDRARVSQGHFGHETDQLFFESRIRIPLFLFHKDNDLLNN